VRPSATLKLNHTGRIAFRRAYANEAPKPKPGKLRRTFRWAWRLTYLSAFGVLGYTAFTIWQDRHPEPQVEQDPKKKTLVVLGESG
jgi:NADH:ubiquinone reductase (non-electrogenic)